MNFTILFKDIRRKEGLTQAEFANKLKISRSAIAQIESSKNNPSRDLILNVLETFDLPNNLKKELEEYVGIDSENVALKGILFNYNELDDNKKEAYEILHQLTENRDVLLSLCYALKELLEYQFTDEEIENLSKISAVIQYLFRVVMPFHNTTFVAINAESILKTKRVLNASKEYISKYSNKLSELYNNKLRSFEDLKGYKEYKDYSEDFPF